MASQYLLVLPIEAMPIGTTYLKDQSLPLHCTVMDWFTLGQGYSFENLATDLTQLIAQRGQQVITLISEKRDYFGPRYEIPLYTLKRSDELNLLHTQLVALLARARSLPEELVWVGAGYRAHVSDADGRRFPTGNKCIAHYLTLIERDEEGNKHVAEIEMLCDEPLKFNKS